MMRGLKKMVAVEFKLFLREPEAFFFTLIFPLIMLFVFGSIYGNEPMDFFGGFGVVDMSVPAYIGMVIAVAGITSLPISVAFDREKGILRRLRATPLQSSTILVAWVIVYFFVTLCGSVLLIFFGKLVYGLRFAGNAFMVFVMFSLSTFSVFSIGFIIASVAKTARIASVTGMALFFPMIFFSGATIPWQQLPPAVQTIGYCMPLTYVVKVMQGFWIGEPVTEHLVSIAVLIGMLIIGVFVSAKLFRWESKN